MPVPAAPTLAAYGPFATDPFLASSDTAFEALRQAGATDPEFATVVIDHSAKDLVVYRTSGQASSAYTQVDTGGIPVRFAAAPRTYADQHNILMTVGLASAQLQKIGISISSAHTDYTGSVSVDLSTVTSAAEALLYSLLPANDAGSLTFTSGPVTTAHFNDRTNDTSPFFGGDSVQSTSAGSYHATCTSGFGGKSNADYVMVAYHCVNPGDKRMFITGHQLIGSDVYESSLYDFALISASESPRIWTNAQGENAGTLPVLASGAPGPGVTFCADGSVTLRRCGGTYQAEYVTTGGGTPFHPNGQQVDEWCATGSNLWVDGDSGGPLYAPNSNGTSVRALGEVSSTYQGLYCSPDIQSHVVAGGPGLNLTTS